MTYGERLRELRAERRLSLRQVEERGGPNKDTMSLIERDVHKPHPQTLGRIAEALELSVSELRAELEGAERPLGQAPPEPRLEGAERRTARDYQVGQAEAFFVPLEEGEEEDTVTLKFYYVRLLEGDEPILKAMRKASPDEEAAMRQELEKAGRTPE